jgi:hypothetical protein
MQLTEDSRRLLLIIIEQHRSWQNDVSKFVANYGDNYFSTEDICEGIGSETPATAGVSFKALHSKLERALEERLKAVVFDMETMFSSLVGKSSKLYNFVSDFLAAKRDLPSSVTSLWNLTLLVDANLQNLPWEGLSLVNDFFRLRSSRDFSLHVLSHRMQNSVTSAPSSIPSGNMKYIVDPLGEDQGSKVNGKERNSVSDAWSTLFSASSSIGKWNKLRVSDGVLSLEDFVLALDSVSSYSAKSVPTLSLFAYCLGRFGSILSPSDIAVMNLEKLQFFCCLDNTFNDVSYRRQNSADVLKNIEDIELEKGYEMSALLSLSGVNSLITNSWSVPIVAHHRFMDNFWKLLTTNRGEKLISAFSRSENSDSLQNQQNVEKEQKLQQKNWIALSRILYGIPSYTYSE